MDMTQAALDMLAKDKRHDKREAVRAYVTMARHMYGDIHECATGRDMRKRTKRWSAGERAASPVPARLRTKKNRQERIAARAARNQATAQA